MVIGDRFIYLELHKTGCTYVKHLLRGCPSLQVNVFGKHNQYLSLPKETLEDFDSKLKMGNVRNPWDWYVSLWAYGCQQGGIFYSRLTERFDPIGIVEKHLTLDQSRALAAFESIWHYVYSDSRDRNLFKLWLNLILNAEDILIPEKFRDFMLSRFAGFMTYRYLQLYTHGISKSIQNLTDFDAMKAYNQKNNLLNITIRFEHIWEDLSANARNLGIDLNELEKSKKSLPEKINSSNRKKYQYYYDDESMDWVNTRDKLVIEKYAYQFD